MNHKTDNRGVRAARKMHATKPEKNASNAVGSVINGVDSAAASIIWHSRAERQYHRHKTENQNSTASIRETKREV
jgi:hypothetical protein